MELGFGLEDTQSAIRRRVPRLHFVRGSQSNVRRGSHTVNTNVGESQIERTTMGASRSRGLHGMRLSSLSNASFLFWADVPWIADNE